MIEQFCIIRTRDAGVHCGVVKECSASPAGAFVKIADARRIWRWRGANSLNELAIKGASEDYTRISQAVDEMWLTQVIEIIPCTSKAKSNLCKERWGS